MAGSGRIALSVVSYPSKGNSMAGPITGEVKTSEKASEEEFDFAETSDLCDFGYVLVQPNDQPVSREPSRKNPA